MNKEKVNNLIAAIYAAKASKEIFEADMENLKFKINTLDADIEKHNEELLAELKSDGAAEYISDTGLYANVFKKENIGYTSDADVLKYLKENNYNEYVKTKITESLDKRPLSKALKTDEKLAAALEAMTVKTTTEYVVVTNAENHQKMLEHIEEGKEK